MAVQRFASLAIMAQLCFLSACAQERVFTQPNSGMEPTVLEGEKFAVDPNAYRNGALSRGDVIVFRHGDILILKRVIALAGDTIEARDPQIILNGKVLREDYVEHMGNKSTEPSFWYMGSFPATKIAAGQLFVMGDNRDFSDDSRDPGFGAVSISDVLGKATRVVKSSDSKRAGTPIR